MMFQPAVKYGGKLRLALAGPAGSGKTYSALAIALGLVPGGKVAVVDTEHGSASKYANRFKFDTVKLEPPHHPDRYVEAIKEAEREGYDVIVIDSLSYAWNGEGGLLQIVDQVAKRTRNPNTYVAWKEATPIQERLIEAVLGSKIHVIATMRSKMAYILQQDSNGKTVPTKVGMEPVQREGMEYYFDVFGELLLDNTLIITKTRCPDIAEGVFLKPGAQFASVLSAWLEGEPAPIQEKEPQENQHSPEELGVLGELRNAAEKLYGVNVEAELSRLSSVISDGKCNKINGLYPDQVQRLLNGITKKLAAVKQAEEEEAIEEARREHESDFRGD